MRDKTLQHSSGLSEKLLSNNIIIVWEPILTSKSICSNLIQFFVGKSFFVGKWIEILDAVQERGYK